MQIISWKDKKEKTTEEKILEENVLPLRCVAFGRVEMGIKKRLGNTYTKLYRRRPGFDGVTLEQYCERFPNIFEVRYDTREIALVLKDNEEDTASAGGSEETAAAPGALKLPVPMKEAFAYYCDKQLPKLKKKRANKNMNEHQMKDVIRSKWRRLSVRPFFSFSFPFSFFFSFSFSALTFISLLSFSSYPGLQKKNISTIRNKR